MSQPLSTHPQTNQPHWHWTRLRHASGESLTLKLEASFRQNTVAINNEVWQRFEAFASFASRSPAEC